MQAGRAFSIASGGTTFARIAECGQAATQWLHWVQSSSFQMGISSAILRFSQRVVPIGQSRLAAAPKRGGRHQARRASQRLRFSRNQERHRNHWRSIGAVRIYRLQRNFFYGFTRQRQSLPIAFHQIGLCYCNFWQSHPAILRGAIAEQNLRQMEKAICMTVLIRAAVPHSRAIFAALIT